MAKKQKPTSYIKEELEKTEVGFKTDKIELDNFVPVQPRNTFLPLFQNELEAIIQQIRIHKGDNTKGIIVASDEQDKADLIAILAEKGYDESLFTIIIHPNQEEAKMFSFSWGIVLNRQYRLELNYIKARIKVW